MSWSVRRKGRFVFKKTVSKEEALRKLYLSNTDKKLGGVCGGLGEYFEKDPTLVRIIFMLIILFSFGFGVLAYQIGRAHV